MDDNRSRVEKKGMSVYGFYYKDFHGNDDSLENVNLTTRTSCSEEHEVLEGRHPCRFF